MDNYILMTLTILAIVIVSYILGFFAAGIIVKINKSGTIYMYKNDDGFAGIEFDSQKKMDNIKKKKIVILDVKYKNL